MGSAPVRFAHRGEPPGGSLSGTSSVGAQAPGRRPQQPGFAQLPRLTSTWDEVRAHGAPIMHSAQGSWRQSNSRIFPGWFRKPAAHRGKARTAGTQAGGFSRRSWLLLRGTLELPQREKNEQSRRGSRLLLNATLGWPWMTPVRPWLRWAFCVEWRCELREEP